MLAGDDGEAVTGETGETAGAELVTASGARDGDPRPIEPIEIEQPATAKTPTAAAPATTAKAVRFMKSPVATFS
jgi:hypothetical protein